ncbi:helix-turn-helix domain-containing protein [Sphingomonas albertensis]|uniref:helix-turn-helix domain-containing protein n=1 Tax=Sphingomonas albertensis TaxID=2762591 RepID=UPI0037D9EE5D
MTTTTSAYKPEMVDIAKGYAEAGATDRDIADLFEVSERTLYRWKHTHPEFAAALVVGKEVADARVEQSLYRRATGYTYDSSKFHMHEGCVIVTPYEEHVPPDTTAAIFWLKNRKPEAWRDKTTVEHELPKDMGEWLGER